MNQVYLTAFGENPGNRHAFLDVIAWSEIGPKLLKASNNGYNVIVGGALFNSYADHPARLVRLSDTLSSTAAGRYQILHRYWVHYKALLGLEDFSPASQDVVALHLIGECRALEDIDDGHFNIAIAKCASRWASLPGAGYNQRENSLSVLTQVYTSVGGTFA